MFHTTFALFSILFTVLFMFQYLIFVSLEIEKQKAEMETWNKRDWLEFREEFEADLWEDEDWDRFRKEVEEE